MPKNVVNGTQCKCSFGSSPSSLITTPQIRPVSGCKQQLATELTNIPMQNILPFGMCSSLANPQVSSATSAAFGVLTPQPCIPVITTPWEPSSKIVNVAGVPAILDNAKLLCSWEGEISITNTAQEKIETSK